MSSRVITTTKRLSGKRTASTATASTIQPRCFDVFFPLSMNYKGYDGAGTLRFRKTIININNDMSTCSQSEKQTAIQKHVWHLRNHEHCHFLARDEDNNYWYEIGDKEVLKQCDEYYNNHFKQTGIEIDYSDNVGEMFTTDDDDHSNASMLSDNSRSFQMDKEQDIYDTVVQQKDLSGMYPLHSACTYKQSESVNQLLGKEFPLAVQHRNDPLHLACANKSVDNELFDQNKRLKTDDQVAMSSNDSTSSSFSFVNIQQQDAVTTPKDYDNENDNQNGIPESVVGLARTVDKLCEVKGTENENHETKIDWNIATDGENKSKEFQKVVDVKGNVDKTQSNHARVIVTDSSSYNDNGGRNTEAETGNVAQELIRHDLQNLTISDNKKRESDIQCMKPISEELVSYARQQILLHKMCLSRGCRDCSDLALMKASQSEKIRSNLKSVNLYDDSDDDDDDNKESSRFVFTDHEINTLLRFYHRYLLQPAKK